MEVIIGGADMTPLIVHFVDHGFELNDGTIDWKHIKGLEYALTKKAIILKQGSENHFRALFSTLSTLHSEPDNMA